MITETSVIGNHSMSIAEVSSSDNEILKTEGIMAETRTELQMIKMSEIQSQEVVWLWYPFIPYGKLTIIQGDPGDGKTTFVLNIAAKLSKGDTTGSKRGLETRVSLKQALSALGFKGGTRRETELNQWVAYEKEQLATVMLEHGIEWEKKGTHEKHLSVLNFEKKEREKEVAELEQSISDGKERLSDIQIQQRKAEQETEQIRQEGEAIRQEVSELSETSNLLKEQAATLAEDKEKLLSDNEKLEKQQKKLQQEIEKMVQSKAVMERNIHAYDEDEKWQLPEPAALMSAKAYKDKKAFPLVEKLKETIKVLTIKCVQLAEQGKKLKDKVTRQEQQIIRLTDKVMEKSDTIDRLQEKVADLERLERYFGRDQVQSIVKQSKALERAEKADKRPKRVFETSR